ncbi:hypothetical protein FS842_000181 [Serendipita sp. 407]|nr:hypothetical protein FS842_000181 [Serendipita sp. 407]
MSNTINLYPLSNFTFSTKEAQPEEDPSVAARLQRLSNNYEDYGMRHTVEGVLVVHDHGHPHILMLQIANAFFKLPGDYLKPGEEEVQGLKSRLDERLAPSPGTTFQFTEQHGIDNDWEIGDCLAQWWRPNFETFMVSVSLIAIVIERGGCVPGSSKDSIPLRCTQWMYIRCETCLLTSAFSW